MIIVLSRFELRIEAREHAARVPFKDRGARSSALRFARRFDVAARVVEVVARLRIDAAHRADHFAGEEDVLDGNHLGEQVDARLVVDAGVEEDVVQQVVLEQRLLHLLRQAAEAPPVVRHRAAAMRDHEAQRREVLEQVRGQALHEGRGVGVQVVRAGGVEAGVAARAHVHHRRDVVLDHLFVDRVPVAVRQRRRGPVTAGRIGVQVDADEAVLIDASLQFGDAGASDQRPGTAAASPPPMKWSGKSCATR